MAKPIAVGAASTVNELAATTSNVHPRDVINKYLWWVIIFAVILTIVFGIKHEFELFWQKQAGKEMLSAIPEVVCPDASAHEVRSCVGKVSNTAWSKKMKPAEGTADNGMYLCVSPGVQSERTEEYGTTWWRFKAMGSPQEVKYRFSPVNECPPDILS